MKKILMIFVLEQKEGKYTDEEGALVIFIDDLDRCPPKKITKVLESINLFFDQEGCFFIIGTDIALISKAIETEYIDLDDFSGSDYIKKMIQLQFNLPAIQEEDIKKFMEIELKIGEPLKTYFDIIVKGLDSNQREIKRFLNSFNLMKVIGESIENLAYDEELLIKWSILNFSSEDFMDEVKTNNRFLIDMQSISKKENKEDTENFLEQIDDENTKELCGKFKGNEKILRVLKGGDKEFNESAIRDYIFLSSVAPKEPEENTSIRLQHLADNIEKDYELLKDYDEALRLTADPSMRVKYLQEINQVRALMGKYQQEYNILQSRTKSSIMQNVANKLQQMNTQLAMLEPIIEIAKVPIKVSLAKLPSTNPELFGREHELEILDTAWANPQKNIITLVAWGGVGKTALVNSWLYNMRQDNFRGAERVFAWSFYSQGASESKQESADVFIASALRWFEDPEPDTGSPWEKGERLAEYVRKQRTLLILDGLEPLQHPFREQEGKIKDPGLQSLLRELANSNPGLCIITTRLHVDDLKDFPETVETIHLEHLSDEAGMELLKYLGVKGTDNEIMQVVRDLEGHALSLMLLGNYLSIVYKGDVQKRDRIAMLIKDKKYGGRARQVIESYEIQFKGQPELDILSIMGLFDRPVKVGAIDVLRADPPIKGLTSQLKDVSHEDWQFALNNLRRAGLLAKDDPAIPDTLDCHPLLRESFGEKLKIHYPEAWKEAHSRLYEYYKNQAKEYPDTIQEMMPLYAAVTHGCQAGRYQEALDEVYRMRILRGNEHFSWKKLGSFGADLAAMSGFFDQLWSKPATELTGAAKSFVLGQAGLYLRALGRLAEAAQPMKASLEAYIAQEDWEYAAQFASNLSELSLTMGDLTQSLEYAEQSVDLADRSGNAFQRMGKRTTQADTLHQAGRLSEAESAFQEAEEMQKEWQPEYSFLYSLQGFQYCDLLLGQGKYRDVQSRAEQTIEWEEGRLLDIALDHLSLGKTHLLQTLQEDSQDFTLVAEHLNQAVDGLRQAGTQHELPRSLLARAELYRVQNEFEKAQRDLDEAMTIAERGEMGLHQADCHLEYARLSLDMGGKEKAREHLATAKEMIGEMGYHRRDTDVREIEEKLL